ncbi:MAG TPA: hypothetical protein PK801_10010 [Aggregatilineales bacterium]|nr:hypothetical protein [Chloroflexota bacterium]HOA23038.1 hypothetical protein [Aggregatilineales bacterium]HPV07141.1 hypothetical protein [Aggregatilineales bacterium]HQA68648.1 hypothetical protein [Aggregatilineales bacterium]HQE16929.1 hypothetical protein [Aggregatilineales bacterium]
MPDTHFDILILIARPAAGKSEIIHYLKQVPDDERVRRFHIGPFVEIDDFPMLWTWFEEDDILERLGYPRLHTDAEGYFKDRVLWHLLIERISLEYAKLMRDHPGYHDERTVIIEFSRGSEHGGYTEAFEHLSEDILRRAAVLYIDVSYEESLRKNRRRFNPERADSILEHGLPDAKLERLYKEIDWEQFSAGSPTHLSVRGIEVPYVVFENHDDVTTAGGEALGERLEARLGALWALYRGE